MAHAHGLSYLGGRVEGSLPKTQPGKKCETLAETLKAKRNGTQKWTEVSAGSLRTSQHSGRK
jgi:hypothetical protein